MMYAYVGTAIAAVTLLLYLLYRFMWKAGKATGAADQRLRDVEGALEVEREMADTMLERPDTSATRKKLQDGTY